MISSIHEHRMYLSRSVSDRDTFIKSYFKKREIICGLYLPGEYSTLYIFHSSSLSITLANTFISSASAGSQSGKPSNFFLSSPHFPSVSASSVSSRLNSSPLQLTGDLLREITNPPVAIMNSVLATPPAPHQLFNTRLSPSHTSSHTSRRGSLRSC